MVTNEQIKEIQNRIKDLYKYLQIEKKEIEAPFNNEENDLPMDMIDQNIERNVTRIFSEV